MEFRVLGPVEAVDGDRPVPLGPPKQRAVLVELLRAGGAVSRERLIESLWSDHPPRSAVGSLQVYVHGLRRALGARRIETVGSAYRLRPEDGDRVDADEFARLLGAARTALAAGRAVAAQAAAEAALALWRGAAIADVTEHGDLAAYARELQDRRLEALELRNEAWLALGRHALVLAEIDSQIAADPYRERLRAQQIVALYRDGRQADALAAYRATRDVWAEELGLEPTRELRELERAVLRHDPSLAPPAAPEPVRCKLPVPPTPLVGRRLEIAAVAALLRTHARLVTLVGAGGTGKTRLALAVAEELEDEHRDGAVFVDLSPIVDATLLVPTIAQRLEVEAVDEYLAERELLLVLDNVEQLVEAAGDIASLLEAAPGLRVLATSRTPLHLAAEHEYAVQPLPFPRAGAPAAELAQAEAVQLFVARARAAGRVLEPDEDVAELCRRLDGLPLAIELAAARTKLLSPREILDRIEPTELAASARDVPARHATLAATIAWSLDLLDPAARIGFGRLAAFAGGFTVAAAERVGVPLDALESLVDKSLVQRREHGSGIRFGMLDTVRAFAERELDQAARLAHAEWATELAEGIEARVDAARLDELEAELDNIRSALEWSVGARVDLALRLISASRPVWEIRHLREGTRLLDRVIEAAGEGWPDLRAKALGFAGTAAFRRGLLGDAAARWLEMLDLYRELGDLEGIARGLSDVGTAAAAQGDWERSRSLLEEAAARFRQLGEAKRLAVVLVNLGHVAAQVGDVEGATAFTLEGLAVQRELGDEQRQAISLNNLGSYAADAGAHDDARRWLDECVALGRRLGYAEVMAHAHVTYARIAAADGNLAAAARHAETADALLEEAGVEIPGPEGARFAALKERLETRVERAPSAS